MRFAIREGGRTVGAGVMTTIQRLSREGSHGLSNGSESVSKHSITRCSTGPRRTSSRRPSGPGRSLPGPCRCRPGSRSSCVIRGPFIDKDSREQFEMRTHKRLIDVLEPTARTVDALMRLNVPAGVDIEIKL